MANEHDDIQTTARPVAAEGAFDAAEPRIEVEDLSYGSRFAHDEHHAGRPAIEPDGKAEVAQMNAAMPWDMKRFGRVVALGLVGASVTKMIGRATRRQRRVALGSVLGAVAAIGVGTWLARRNA